MNNFTTRTWSEALALYTKNQPSDWSHIPDAELSDERCGGWIMRDAENYYIGFVSNYGSATYTSHKLTTVRTKFDEKGRVLNPWEKS
tara:strand:+ start:482 stop:742 length:261 start_codon:yes stop_codon:yes gene_type:complete